MFPNASHARVTSALGEWLVAVLVVAAVGIAGLAGYSEVVEDTNQTADRAQARVDSPVALLRSLESEPASSTRP